jgi:hypothetical protein
MAASREDVKFLSNPKLGLARKKYCRFRKFGIKYIDYKDADFCFSSSMSKANCCHAVSQATA